MKFQRIDHVGINVNDLQAAKAFFLDVGMEVLGEGESEGAWLDQIVGLKNAKTALVMLGMPGSQTNLELVKWYQPADERGIEKSYSNTLGIRHITFVVDDVEAVVARLKKHGAELVGEIKTYENEYKLCYIRGPEGIILELAEEIH